MVNSAKQKISKFIGERKSAKQIVWHYAAQLVNKQNCSLLDSPGYSGYHRYKACEKRKDFGPSLAQILKGTEPAGDLRKALKYSEA